MELVGETLRASKISLIYGFFLQMTRLFQRISKKKWIKNNGTNEIAFDKHTKFMKFNTSK